MNSNSALGTKRVATNDGFPVQEIEQSDYLEADHGERHLTRRCGATVSTIPDLHFRCFGTVDFNQKGTPGQAAWHCSSTPSRHTLQPGPPVLGFTAAPVLADSFRHAFTFRPNQYPARPPFYSGRFRFKKHYYFGINDLSEKRKDGEPEEEFVRPARLTCIPPSASLNGSVCFTGCQAVSESQQEQHFTNLRYF